MSKEDQELYTKEHGEFRPFLPPGVKFMVITAYTIILIIIPTIFISLGVIVLDFKTVGDIRKIPAWIVMNDFPEFFTPTQLYGAVIRSSE